MSIPNVKKMEHGINRIVCSAKTRKIKQNTILYDYVKSEVFNMTDASVEKRNGETIDTQYEITPDYAFKILQKIKKDHWKYVLLNPNPPSPTNLIISIIPVPPLCIRPTVEMGDNRTNEDDLTLKLFEILKQQQVVKLKISQGQDLRKVNEEIYNIQLLYNQLLNSEASESTITNNFNNIKGLLQRIKGKGGRFRNNLSGKRVEYSARTVISPDPNVALDEVNLPKFMAKELTFPETVTQRNKKRLRQCVLNGKDEYPGASHVTLKGFKNRFFLKNKQVCRDVAKKLQKGDVVHRHLVRGDVVMFNRQPSLHRQSIMAFKIRVHNDKTLKFNECVCSPFNADFDGDEMNIHVLQTIPSKVEALSLMRSTVNLFNPKSGEVNISLIQDFLTTTFDLTSKERFFNREQFCSLLAMATNAEMDLVLPRPAILKPKTLWTGKQLVSVILDTVVGSELMINLKIKEKQYNGVANEKEFDELDSFVNVQNNQLLSGQVGKSTMGSSKSGLLYYIAKQHSNIKASEMMMMFSRLSAKNIELIGISFGLKDVTPDNKTIEFNRDLFSSKIKSTEEIVKKYTKANDEAFKLDFNDLSLEDKAELEAEITDVLNKARDEAGGFLLKNLSASNNALKMAVSGAKGSSLNICQMIATVGQQIVSGKRVQNGFLNRTLPHFKEHEISPESRGFVQNSFYTGLRPTEFFFHTMAGREGLIDTAVKTANTGYMQRRLIKVMEDLVVEYDYTVRNSDKKLIQFFYGEDGFDPQMNEIDDFPIDLSVIDPEFNLKNVRDDVDLSDNRDVKGFWQQWKKIIPCYEISDKIRNTLNHFIVSQKKHEDKDKRIRQLIKSLSKSVIQPGDAVGALTAQSLGEPCTQMTLKTFHFAGVASMNVTMGVPRIEEIFNATHTIKTPIINVKLLDNKNAETAKLIKNQINSVFLKDILSSIEEIYDSHSSYLLLNFNLDLINSTFVNVS